MRTQTTLPAYGSGDMVLEGFVRALLGPDDARQVLRGFYTDALHETLLSRLASLRANDAAAPGQKVGPLPKWRLRRVIGFVDANIDERISLEALAQVAGISRMYFAAQFRAATGQSPHDYLTFRRIDLAKRMLRDPARAVVDVALTVGFQTQSHFTTVFKRIVGLTPARWRELCADEVEA
jgi:AraC-like DNA-binding protein